MATVKYDIDKLMEENLILLRLELFILFGLQVTFGDSK